MKSRGGAPPPLVFFFGFVPGLKVVQAKNSWCWVEACGGDGFGGTPRQGMEGVKPSLDPPPPKLSYPGISIMHAQSPHTLLYMENTKGVGFRRKKIPYGNLFGDFTHHDAEPPQCMKFRGVQGLWKCVGFERKSCIRASQQFL